MQINFLLLCALIGKLNALTIPEGEDTFPLSNNATELLTTLDEVDGVTVGMVFTGRIKIGEPEVTLAGTAESIYAQILALNPSYDPEDFVEYREHRDELVAKRDLAKRGHMICNGPGAAIYSAWDRCHEGMKYLERLNGYCGAPQGPGGCSRVSCSNSCGIHLCNDNRDRGIQVWCGNLAGDYRDIYNSCRSACQFGGPGEDPVYCAKGQVFRDGPPAWNTHIKSQNC